MDAISVPDSLWAIAGRLLIATLFGAVVGLNRERHGKPAGLRTHALVALGGALFTIAALMMRSDDPSAPARIVQGITAGIGFIGGGVILRRPDTKGVHHLTTAAAIWIVSAVGVAAGAGLWRTSAIALVLTLLVLVVGESIDERLHREPPEAT
jgi:putative Mg2+ transporter-C (MgtC) family protein